MRIHPSLVGRLGMADTALVSCSVRFGGCKYYEPREGAISNRPPRFFPSLRLVGGSPFAAHDSVLPIRTEMSAMRCRSSA